MNTNQPPSNSQNPEGQNPDERGEQFITQYTNIESDLRSFILANLASWSDAQEILQQTCLIMWRKSGDFTQGTSFFNWACQIAKFEILKYRKAKAQGKNQLIFSDEILSQIQDRFENDHERLGQERQALVECQELLTDKDRELVKQCYYGSSSIKDVAIQTKKTPTSLYKRLNRVREILCRCIENKIKRWN